MKKRLDEVQYVYLDFDGEVTTYDNADLDIRLDVEVQDSGINAERTAVIADILNQQYAGLNVEFVTWRPAPSVAYSTIYVGKADAVANESWSGLAETIDKGNQVKNDDAFVFADYSYDDSAIVETIAHEVDHIVFGEEHLIVPSEATLADYAETSFYTYSSNFSRSSVFIETSNSSRNGYKNDIHYYTLKVASGQTATITITCESFPHVAYASGQLRVLTSTGDQIYLSKGQSKTFTFTSDALIGLNMSVAGTSSDTYALNANYAIKATYSAAAQYDLKLMEMSIYDGYLCLSSEPNDYENASSSFSTDDTVYLTFVAGDDEMQKVDTPVAIYVDGSQVYKGNLESTELSGGYVSFMDSKSLGKMSAGSHTVKVVVDPDNKVAETNESNNTYTKTITVKQVALPDLKPYMPTGWSGSIVASTATGTTTDASKYTTGDNVYVDFAFENDGPAVTGSFYAAVYLDDEVIDYWEINGIGANSSYLKKDVNFGKLSAGSHTIYVLVDPLESISESDESNNLYKKTITVSQSSSSADSYESGEGDGSRFKATKLAVGTTQSHTLHTATDEDWMVFEVDDDGFYSIVTDGCDTVLQLYSFENQAFCYHDDRGNGDTGSFDTAQLYAGTKYYARVTGKNGAQGNYSIKVTQGVVEDAFERNNDDVRSGASLLKAGETQSHTIDSADDVDWLKFVISEQGKYFFTIGTSERDDGQIAIELYNGSGSKIDVSVLNSELYKLSGENPYIAATYDVGTYYVKVTSAKSKAAGLYSVGLSAVSTFNETDADGYEDDGPWSVSNWAEIKTGETQHRSLNVWTTSDGEYQKDVDNIMFTPQETGTYAVKVSGSDAPTQMTVYVIDDFGIMVPVGGDTRINPFVENYFQSGQTYCIKIENNYLHLNVENYDLTVVKTASFTSEKDGYEGDDSRSSAKAIALGETQAHSIHTVGDQDWVKFTPTTSGYYTFHTGARNGNAGDPDMVLGLYDSNGKLLANDDNSFSVWNAMVAYQLTAGETYYLQAQAAKADTVVPYYTIALEQGVIEDAFDIYMDERSVNDNTMDWAQLLTLNVPSAHTLHTAEDVDWSGFFVYESGTYTVQTTGSGDTFIRLYDADGSLLATDDDSGIGKNASVTFGLTGSDAGTVYYVEVTSSRGEVVPYYSLVLTEAESGAGDAYEDDDTRARAKGIVAGETQSRSIHDGGDEDWVLFRPIQSGAYQIQTTGDADMKLDLYDANGSMIASDDDSGTGLNARIGQTLQANTDYYVRAYAYKDNVTVEQYGLNVTLLEKSDLGDEYENDNSPAAAKAIRLGETQSHSIHTAGDVDWVTFTPTKGGEYTIQTVGSGLNCDTQLYLYTSLAAAQSDKALQWDDDSGTDRNAKITRLLEKDVTYYIKASAWKEYTIPSYGLKVTLGEGDEYENDDLSGDCKPIAIGREYSHSIHTKSDTDWVRFYTHESGSYTIQTTGDADMSFIVYKRTPGGPLVPYNDGKAIVNGGSGKNALYTVDLEADNWYYVRLTTAGRQTTAANYGVRVDLTEKSAATGDSYETSGGKANDNAASRATWLTTNVSQVHSIHVAGDQDWFAYKTSAAGRYTLSLSSLGVYAYSYVLDESTGSLTYIDRTGAMGTTNTADVDVEANKTYYFKVTATSGDMTVDKYTISLSLPMDAYENDDLSSKATELEIGQEQGHSLHTSEDVDWVLFSVDTTGDYRVHNDNDGSVSMILYRDNGASKSVVGQSNESAVYKGLSAGKYYIRMASADQSANTGYSVKVTRDVTTAADAYESDDSRSAAKDITVGSAQTHSLHTTTDVDYVKFYAAANTTSTISTNGADLSVRILDSKGSTLASDSGNGASAYYTATSAGYYYASVSSTAGQEVSAYSVSLSQSTVNTEENYAILFNGGGDSSSNHANYYIALKQMYLTLVNVYGLDPSNIFIVSADGTNSALDQSLTYYNTSTQKLYTKSINSDYSFATKLGTKVTSATKSNLTSAVKSIASQMDSNDHFLFWATDHGSDSLTSKGDYYGKGSEVVCGWGRESITGAEFNKIFSEMTDGYQSFMFSTCFSGGVLDALDVKETATRKRWGAAAASEGEFGWSAAYPGSEESYNSTLGGYVCDTISGWDATAIQGLNEGVSTTSDLAAYIEKNADFVCHNSHGANEVCTEHYNRDYYGIVAETTSWTDDESVSHPWSKGSSFQIFAQT